MLKSFISRKTYLFTESRLILKSTFLQTMKLNWNTKVMGEKVILVPYGPQHVPKYHEWMKSDELQYLTGSEPLTLEEEFEMQETWKNSEDKCTFIILHKETFEKNNHEIDAMVGDTNIFIRVEDNGDKIGEAEIMVADQQFRGQKLGWQAMICMFLYAVNHLNLDSFEVKIKFDNAKSIKMFEKLHFKESSRSEVFEEITLELKVNDDWCQFLKRNVPNYKELKYEDLSVNENNQ